METENKGKKQLPKTLNLLRAKFCLFQYIYIHIHVQELEILCDMMHLQLHTVEKLEKKENRENAKEKTREKNSDF